MTWRGIAASALDIDPAFHPYRIFDFRQAPALYILQGDLAGQLHLQPMDYRASFRRLTK